MAPRANPRLRHAFALGAVTVLLASCSTTYGPQGLRSGATVSEVTAALGAPTARYARADGERVEYARGPYGKHTYMLDFDSQGRLLRWEQVLTEPHFDALRVGASRDDVLFTLGHPSEAKPLPHQRRILWSYRYEGPFCKWFQVGLDGSGQVVDTGYGPDPLCDDYQTSISVK
jgi:outer membrane protein assembly factor BamE (lipoprotein component of BamABCDE complex)